MNETDPCGIYPDIPNSEYHSDETPGINPSLLLEFMKHPRFYEVAVERQRIMNGETPEEVPPLWAEKLKEATKKDSFEIGSALHLLLEDEDAFEKEVIDDGGINRNSKAFKELKSENQDKIILKPIEYEQVIYMRNAIKNSPCWNFFESGHLKQEYTYIWREENSGEIVKTRPDLINVFCFDFKTTAKGCAEPERFFRHAYDFGYHIKAAMILDGIAALEEEPIDIFCFLTVEKEYPFLVTPYICDRTSPYYDPVTGDTKASFIEIGRRQYRTALSEFASYKAAEKKERHGYIEMATPLDCYRPTWLK